MPYSQAQGHSPTIPVWTTTPLSYPYAPPSWTTPALNTSNKGSIRLHHAQANHFVDRPEGSESLIQDGETALSTLLLEYPINPHWQLGLSLPYVNHRTGFLDGVIYRWHDWFGMPQAGRTRETNNRLYYFYEDGEGRNYTREEAVGGIGDLRLQARHVQRTSNPWSLTFELRAPTGDADKLTGSGGWGASLGAGITHPRQIAGMETENYLAGGLTWNEEGEIALADRREPWLASIRLGSRWRLSPTVWLQGQLDSHTGIYDSEQKSLAGSAVQVTVGLDWALSPALDLHLGFSEDLNTTVTADFAANLGLRYQFLTESSSH